VCYIPLRWNGFEWEEEIVMTASSAALASKAESTLRDSLPEIEGVRVRTEGEDIREIHVLTRSSRAPKKIVRDIQTVLSAGLGLQIDHRVVSIVRSPGSPAAEVAPEFETVPSTGPARVVSSGPELVEVTELPARDPRIRFESVNLFVSGARTQAQVELQWRGSPRVGSASGWSSRDESHRLVAEATAAAVQEMVDDPVALGVTSVELVTAGKARIALVSLTLLAHRQEKLLTGSCVIEQDTPQAVVLATLAALNRVVGGLRVKEPTEYVLRPTTD
jgi:hypothetical protein